MPTGDFTTVLKTSDLTPGDMRLVDVNGTDVVVANVDGSFCAFAASCSHEQGPLAEGELDGAIVTCPWHFTEFDVRTGEVIDGVTDEPIATYKVRIDGDNVQVSTGD